MLLQVVEELAATTCHSQQAAARMEILAMGTQVLGKVVDASAQKSDLYVARTGVLIVRFEIANYLAFIDSFAVWHTCYSDHGIGGVPFGKPLAKRVAGLTAVARFSLERSVEESAQGADL